VASSFEPRSVHAAKLLEGNVERAVTFNYDDTLNTEMGIRHAQELDSVLIPKSQSRHVMHCRVAEPFSVVRAFHTYVTHEHLVGNIRSVVLDATCFTKLHLLLLLRYLWEWLRVDLIRVCYTKPLMYATAFGQNLSYGIQRTVYLPYCATERVAVGTGMIAFLGHEPHRLERLVQEIEPDLCLMLLGEPGFTNEIAAYSRKANERLIRRTEYDRHYQYDVVPADDIERCVEAISQKLEVLQNADCGHIYLAPLGTKLQALSIDIISQRKPTAKLSLAYSIPERYESCNYSHGAFETILATMLRQKKEAGLRLDPIPIGGAIVTDADVNALRDELGI